MSTNYYIYKRNRLPEEDLTHIGKSVFVRPKGEFIWAIHPKELDEISMNHSPLEVLVIDESGKKYTHYDFNKLIENRRWNCEHVGESFS
ncbi:MAG: hypothetical protein A4E27_00280 [Methanobacterium sp. PtaU1.Bin242]|nr:MAG: hypothetical protein A4E27_00280 [Methanobacterium sp. PtaU1.Bin242]